MSAEPGSAPRATPELLEISRGAGHRSCHSTANNVKELSVSVPTEISMFSMILVVCWITMLRQLAGWSEFIKNERSAFTASFWYRSRVVTPSDGDKRANQSCFDDTLITTGILYKSLVFVRLGLYFEPPDPTYGSCLTTVNID